MATSVRTNGHGIQAAQHVPAVVIKHDAPIPFDVEEARRAILTLAFLNPDDVVEMRLPGSSKGTISGYFDDPEKLVKSAASVSGKFGASCYFTLNQIRRDLLARSANHLTRYCRHTSKDDDVLARRWLPVDIDPVRPAGISSTEEEHDAAIALARKISAERSAQGWPAGTVIDSGNGAQLLYRIDLPNDQASASLIERTLKGLAGCYDNAATTIDLAVFNASRIWKLPGTLAVKGDSTAERPHRLARVLSYGPPQVITPEQLEKVAVPQEKPAAAKSNGRTTQHGSFDLDELLRSYGDQYTKSSWKGGSKYVFKTCPNNPEHKNSFCVTQQPNGGGISAKCLHQSCGTFDWASYRALREPGRGLKAATASLRPVVENMDAEPAPDFRPANGHADATTDQEDTVLASAALGQRADMPDTVLDGRLGEICQTRLSGSCMAYAWPSLVVTAGASPCLKFVGNPLRSNLFVCLVGPTDTGKSSTSDRCLHVLGLGPSDPTVLPAKFGSGEALMQELDRSGPCVRILYPDELKHLLVKAGIEGASFPTLLTTAYYHDEQRGGTRKNKEQFKIDCRLSITGGVVEDDFGECFGSASVSGLYDRFIFGLCPAPYRYLWQPYEGGAESVSCFAPMVAADVWDERNQWIADGISPRVAEHCLRIAYICAAVDRRQELRASQLGPALAMAKYQMTFRGVMRPNPGQNPIAQCAVSVRSWLEQNGQGKWVRRRYLSRAIHSARLGPAIFNQTLVNLALNGEIESRSEGREVRLVPE